MRTALTIGTFDCPHVGHAHLLQQCRELADHVTVAVNSDAFVEEYKGARPVFNQLERMHLMGLIADEVLLNDGAGREVIWGSPEHGAWPARWDVLVVGSDWLARDYLAQIDMAVEELAELGTTLAYVPYTEGISTSEIKRRLA